MRYKGKICVPDDEDLKRLILKEAHNSRYTMHLGSMKMYQNLRGLYHWAGLKRDVAKFVSKCLTCQKVKVEQQKSAGLPQPLNVPTWK